LLLLLPPLLLLLLLLQAVSASAPAADRATIVVIARDRTVLDSYEDTGFTDGYSPDGRTLAHESGLRYQVASVGEAS
jgi:hypothetical protein